MTTPSEPTVVTSESESRIAWIEAKQGAAEAIVKLVLKGPDSAVWWTREFLMKRTMVSGYIGLSAFGECADGWGIEGATGDGFCIGGTITSMTEDMVAVNLDLPSACGRTGLDAPTVEFAITMGTVTKRMVGRRCEVIASYRHLDKRSNYRLKPPTGGGLTPD
jgi:hypothetical protein